ncbi:hypothetical+protein [Methylocapsa aurea]
MSIVNLAWAFRQAAGSPEDKLVLIVLADRAIAKEVDASGGFVASVARVANMTPDETEASLRRLLDRGLIEHQERVRDRHAHWRLAIGDGPLRGGER